MHADRRSHNESVNVNNVRIEQFLTSSWRACWAFNLHVAEIQQQERPMNMRHLFNA
jgi:hypothetical protein